MRRLLFLTFAMLLSLNLLAQLEVKEESFKEVPGFVNINTEKMYDDNDKPYAVIKIRTENINNKQRRELVFEGNAATFFELEYKVGEIWVYISYYATFIKISHPDLSSTEFWFPFDMEPKKGYELTVVSKPSVDEDILKRLVKLENANNVINIEQKSEMNSSISDYEIKTVKLPKQVHSELALGGISVSYNKQVVFSKGNLQYLASTDSCRFAINQWDIIGEKNKNISRNYNDWIDLFTWNSLYNIVNNDNTTNWRTLTKEEWLFIIDKRQTDSGIRFAKAKVNGINGVIVFPDSWKNSKYDVKNANRKDVDYKSNKISKEEWLSIFEAEGACFLPCAGRRDDKIMYGIGECGVYWSITIASDDSNQAYDMYFTRDVVNAANKNYCHGGFSIRLVRDVK